MIVENRAALVIVDPLVAYLGSGVDSHRDQDVRRALSPLAKLAEETGAAIVGVRHLNKSAGTNAKYRGGSIGILGAARSGLLVAIDPDDEERPIVASSKSNLGAPVAALAYRLEDADNGVARVRWEGPTAHSADSLLAIPADPEERSAREEAVEVLGATLEDGPLPANEVKRQTRATGISERQLKHAKARLGVLAQKTGFAPSIWYWALPKDAARLQEMKAFAFDRGSPSSYREAESGGRQLSAFGEDGQADPEGSAPRHEEGRHLRRVTPQPEASTGYAFDDPAAVALGWRDDGTLDRLGSILVDGKLIHNHGTHVERLVARHEQEPRSLSHYLEVVHEAVITTRRPM